MLTLTIALSLCIGLILGLLGGGGSILTVPMLVYVLGIETKAAIVTSFVVIGSSSLIALIPHARSKAVCWKSGFWFGISGTLAAFTGGRLATQFPNELLMLMFGCISLLTGLLMLKKPQISTESLDFNNSLCPLHTPFFKLVMIGGLVGLITGMVGVGGGFLIVPALSMLVGLPIQSAIGTSLMIIFLNAVAGLMGYSQYISLDWQLAGFVAASTITGSMLGAVLNPFIQPEQLKRGFALLVVFVACYVLYQNSQAAYQLLWPNQANKVRL